MNVTLCYAVCLLGARVSAATAARGVLLDRVHHRQGSSFEARLRAVVGGCPGTHLGEPEDQAIARRRALQQVGGIALRLGGARPEYRLRHVDPDDDARPGCPRFGQGRSEIGGGVNASTTSIPVSAITSLYRCSPRVTSQCTARILPFALQVRAPTSCRREVRTCGTARDSRRLQSSRSRGTPPGTRPREPSAAHRAESGHPAVWQSAPGGRSGDRPTGPCHRPRRSSASWRRTARPRVQRRVADDTVAADVARRIVVDTGVNAEHRILDHEDHGAVVLDRLDQPLRLDGQAIGDAAGVHARARGYVAYRRVVDGGGDAVLGTGLDTHIRHLGVDGGAAIAAAHAPILEAAGELAARHEVIVGREREPVGHLVMEAQR